MNRTKKLILFVSLMAQALAPSLSLAATYRYDRFVPTLKVTEPANPGGGAQTGGGSGGSTGEGTNGGTGGSTGGGLPPGTDPVAVLGVSSRDLTFGFVQNGSSKTKQLLVTNIGGAALTFAQEPMVSGEGFSASTTCGVTLAASSNCLINVVFSPTVEKRYSGALALTPSVGEPLTVTLSGYGQNSNTNFSISSTTYNFGEVIVGKASPRQYFSVYNDGTEPVSAFEVTVEGPFEVTSSCTPATNLQPLTSCSFGVAAKPSLAQVQAGTVTVTAGGISRQLSLAVTGIDSVQELSPGLVNFGSTLPPNVAAVQAVNLSNQGAAVTYTAPVLTGTGYSLASGGTCSNTGGTLAADDTCSFLVQLNSTAGARNGTITVTAGGKALTSSLYGNVISTTVGFSGSRSGFTSPTTSTTATNNVGVDASSASTTFPTIYVYSAAATARTYNVWVEGDAGIYVTTSALHSSTSTTGSRTMNSAALFQVSTTSAYPTLGLNIKADTAIAGTHTKTATLRVVATDGSYDAALPLTANFRWNVAVGAAYQRPDSNSSQTAYVSGTVVNLGTTIVALNSAETTGTLTRDLIVRAAGTHGKMRGYWSLAGSPDFTLVAVNKLMPSNNGTTLCGATISADKQSSSVCTGDELSLNSSTYYGMFSKVSFKPTMKGTQSATLTFTPVDSTQGAPVTFLLSATGENNVGVGAAYQRPGSGSSLSAYVAGSTVNVGTTVIALNVAETTGSLVRDFVVRATGTHGKMRGYWTLSGSSDFTLSAVKQFAWSNSAITECGAAIATDKQSSSVCTAYDISDTSSIYQSMFATVSFIPTSKGVKTATLTFTPVDNTQGAPVSFLLSATAENNVGVGAAYHRPDSNSSLSNYGSGATVDLGATVLALNSAETSGTLTRDFVVRATGTHGKMRGYWSLSGSSDFTLFAVKQFAWSNAAMTVCGATISTDKQSSTVCTGSDLSDSSQDFKNMFATVNFKPSSKGLKTATLTFTPVDTTQGAPVTFLLSASGENDARAGTPFSSTSSSPTSPFASYYNASTGTSYGNVAISQTALRSFAVKAAGSFGRLRGQWAITGSSDFTISSVYKGYNTSTVSCGATVAADKRSSSTCTVDELSGTSSYTNTVVQVQFKPSFAGPHSATLTFTPDANQGSPVSFSLSATAQ